MRKKFALYIIFCITFSVTSQDWKQVYTETKVVFIITNFGINVDGNFKEVNIKTNFNSNKLSESYINAEISVQSISTGIESRDYHILKEAYFDEKNYKKIGLKSTKIEKNKDETFSLFAEVTIKGVSKKMTIPLKIIENGDSLTISSNFTINRKDFGISGGGFVLSNAVKINVLFKGIK